MSDRDNGDRRRFAELLEESSLGSAEVRRWIDRVDPTVAEQTRRWLSNRTGRPDGADGPPGTSTAGALLDEHPEYARELFAGPPGDPLRFRLGPGPWASGAQGVLYRAIEVGPGRYPFALKQITTDGDVDEMAEGWDRRLRQFRTLYANARFATPIEMFVGSPPAPPGCHDTDRRRIFVLMPWVDGDTLTAHLDEHRGPRHLIGTLQLLLPVAETLDWLQSQRANHTGDRFVHGDVKPGNIIATNDGGVLVDPDLTRQEIRDVEDRWGTPRYAAPEVFERGDYTGASDRFSFGKVVCEVLLGEPPPDGADSADLRRRLRESEPLRERPGLVGEIVPMIAPSPGRRPAQAAPWLRSLIGTLRDEGLPDADELRRRRRRRLIGAGAAGVLLAGVIAVGGYVRSADACRPQAGDGAGRGNGVLQFGVLVPSSGQLTAEAPQQIAAAELARKDITDAGGIRGIQVSGPDSGTELDEGPSGSGQVCASAATLLAKQVDAVIGPSSSTNSAAVVQRITAAGGILVSPASTAPGLTAPGVGRFFRTAPSDVLQGRVLGDLVVADGHRSVTVVARDDNYGHDLSAELAERMRDRGAAVQEVSYSATDPEFGPVVDRLRAEPADTAVVLVGYDETAALLRGMAGAGIGPAKRPVYGTEGYLRDTLPGQVDSLHPDVLTGLRGTALPVGDPRFVARLRSFRPGLADISFAAQTYDATIVTALAAASAHTDDPAVFAPRMSEVTGGGTECTTFARCKVLIEAGRDIDYVGVSGALRLTGTGDRCAAAYSVVQFDARGQLTYVRTVDAGPCT